MKFLGAALLITTLGVSAAAQAECSAYKSTRNGPNGENYVVGMDLGSNPDTCAYQQRNINGVRLWASWRWITENDLRPAVTRWYKQGFRVTVTISGSGQAITSSYPEYNDANAMYKRMQTIMSWTKDTATGTYMVDNFQLGNELGMTGYWPANDNIVSPVNYVKQIWYPMVKAIRDLEPNRAKLRVYTGSIHANTDFLTNAKQQMREQLLLGLKGQGVYASVPMSDRHLFMPDGFDLHLYKTASTFISMATATRARYLNEFNVPARAVAAASSDAKLRALSGIPLRLMLSEWNCNAGPGGSTNTAAEARLCLSDSAFMQKLSTLFDETYYYIFNLNNLTGYGADNRLIGSMESSWLSGTAGLRSGTLATRQTSGTETTPVTPPPTTPPTTPVTTAVSAGHYNLMSAANPSFCLNVAGGKDSAGAGVGVWTCTNANHERIHLLNAAGTPGQIKLFGDTRCLDLDAAGNAVIAGCLGSSTQSWTVLTSGGAVVNRGTGKCLEASNATLSNGLRLRAISVCATTPLAHQRWTFKASTASVATTVTAPPPTSAGKFVLRSQGNAAFCFNYASQSNGAGSQLGGCSTGARVLQFTASATTLAPIKNEAGSFCLDLNASSQAVMSVCNSSSVTQRWRYDAAKGAFINGNRRALEIAGGYMNGTQIKSMGAFSAANPKMRWTTVPQ